MIATPTWVKNGKFGGCLEIATAKTYNVRVPLTHGDSLTVAMWASYKNLASNNIGLIHIQADDLDNGNSDAKIVGIWVGAELFPPVQGKLAAPRTKKGDTWHYITMLIDP